jgi:hypothetical protein
VARKGKKAYLVAAGDNTKKKINESQIEKTHNLHQLFRTRQIALPVLRQPRLHNCFQRIHHLDIFMTKRKKKNGGKETRKSVVI